MNSLIAFALKFSSVGKLWEKLDGYKTKVGAIGLMVAGAGVMLGGLAGMIQELVRCADLNCAVGLVRGIAADDNAATLLKGYITLKAGLMGFGLRHAIEKSSNEPKS